ncbi:MAG: DUF2461 domain-containing protein [Pseudomonadota bacterium]
MMDAPFLGFRPAAFAWFAGLKADNTKSYFEASRDVFETEVKEPLNRLLGELGAELGGTVKVFRQNRDVRFSKDKSPYKLNTYGVVQGLGGGSFGLYVSINDTRVMAGTGLYDPAKDQLDRMRSAINDETTGSDLEDAIATAEQAGVALEGSALKTAPRGFPKDHPRIELLRLKQILLMHTLPKAKAIDRVPYDHAMATWAASKDVVDWLTEHVGESEIPPEVRFARGRK